tara:strand:- start:7615 stop:8118 length:504 start_codon:yes stop_codon:yes gene_type:complete
MTNESRVSKGQPTGGQFAAKTYGPDDITLLSAAVERSADQAWAVERQTMMLRAKFISTVVLAEHPTAAKVTLFESDFRGTTWCAGKILDADDNYLGDPDDLDISAEFFALPGEEPTRDVIGEDGIIRYETDPEFAWLTVDDCTYGSGSATFHVAAAHTIDESALITP